MARLDGKVAVITGATSSIGLRTAEVFVAEGARIVIAGRRIAEGEALARQLGAACIFRQSVREAAEPPPVIASEAKQSSFPQSRHESWIASSLRSSQ